MSETQLFQELRPTAFAIAYRMLGSVSEADDMVQESFIRLHRTLQEGERLESPRAYLSTVVTRLCIDQLRSARARRESYIGEWLPEPIVASADEDPASHAEMSDSLSLAFLVLLENLSPEQRAAFLLRDVFDYPYSEVARILDKSEDNARQLVTRARRYLAERRPRYEATPERHESLAKSFFSAVENGDLSSLEALLADDVALHGDGGGKTPAIRQAILGRAKVAQTLYGWAKLGRNAGGFTMRRTRFNGQPGALMLDPEERVLGVIVLEIADGRIQSVNSIINPDKLRHLGPLGDIRSLIQGQSQRNAGESA